LYEVSLGNTKHDLKETAYFITTRYGCLRFNPGNTKHYLKETAHFITTIGMVVRVLMLGTQKKKKDGRK
jgi:hypothetical protein